MTQRSVPPTATPRRISELGPRALFVVVSLAFTWANHVVWVDVLAAAGTFGYMGVRVIPKSPGSLLPFWFLAVLPACWLRIHLRRPSDLVQLFLYYAVHIPTAVLLPLVSFSSTAVQLGYTATIAVALCALDVRYLLPVLRVPTVRVPTLVFWAGVFGFYALALGVFARSGYLSLQGFDVVQVYAQRQELTDRAAEIGRLFFYLANWTGAALAPFLIIAGFHRRRFVLAILGVAVAAASFIASSNRANSVAIPAVIGGYVLLRMTRGRHLGVLLGAVFLALTALTVLLDLSGLTGVSIPVVTFQVFHRIFTNNGFLSAIYLDAFGDHRFAYYADSFLRWIPGPRLESPVPVYAGESFTDVPGVWANANLWADAFANLGTLGIAFTTAITTMMLWVYDSITSRKNMVIAATALVMPASALANTSSNVALVSNGIFLVFVLMYLWRGADLRVARRATT